MRELREVLVLHDEVMKVVAKIVGAGCASVAVEYAEETYLGPLNGQVLFALWLKNVEDDRYAIFIVVANNALICICCVALNHTTFLL